MGKQKTLTVFYDGACPLCRREIAFYQKRRGAQEIEWRDVSNDERRFVAPGLSACDARARFHVRDARGVLHSGGDAFASLWRALPAFYIAGQLARLQPFCWILNRSYNAFLKIRPHVQALMRRRADV